MLDVPMEMLGPTSLSDLDLALAAGGFEGGGAIEDGGSTGGGAHALFNPNNYWKMTESKSMVQSDGYVLADYDGDERYDQAWETRDGQWVTTTDGKNWYPDDGPIDEWEWLQRRDSL